MIYLNVTNTVRTQAKTGIQRVVRELASRLNVLNNFTLIAWSGDFFSQLSANDCDSFLNAKVVGQLSSKVNFEKGDYFFDIDGSWGDPYCASTLFKMLRSMGVVIIKMHYDAVPILFKAYSHPNTVFSYFENFSASLKYADYWLCISKTVEADLLAIAKNVNAPTPISTVVKLGSDFEQSFSDSTRRGISELSKRKFILSVGTIEPRKNHDFLIDVYEHLKSFDSDINLVIVGKEGWNISQTKEKILKHRYFENGIFWIPDASDNELSDLYKNAIASVNFSHYEGYGLPVIESLNHGCVTFCTKNTAMEEVSEGAAYSIDISSKALDVAQIIQRVINSPLYDKYKSKAVSFTAPSWDNSVSDILDFFSDIGDDSFDFPPKQLVYISIRPDLLCRSILSFIEKADFITSFVVLTSNDCYSEMCSAISQINADVTVIKESDLNIVSLPDDHQERNTYLRSILYSSEHIEDNFIACDDDYLVIEKCTVDIFWKNGMHNAYCFFENGHLWLGGFPSPTSFDEGIWRTSQFLEEYVFDVKLYNSHMPQIINKKVSGYIFKRTKGFALDEWSSYFNIAKHLYPNRFADFNYISMGWPCNADSWLPSIIPDHVLFENHYIGVNSNFEEWRELLWKELQQRKTIEPKKPVLTLDDKVLRFSDAYISCKHGAKLFIQLDIKSESLLSLTCSFASHKDRFYSSSMPRCLFIPTSIFSLDLKKIEVLISCEFVSGCKSNLKILLFLN